MNIFDSWPSVLFVTESFLSEKKRYPDSSEYYDNVPVGQLFQTILYNLENGNLTKEQVSDLNKIGFIDAVAERKKIFNELNPDKKAEEAKERKVKKLIEKYLESREGESEIISVLTNEEIPYNLVSRILRYEKSRSIRRALAGNPYLSTEHLAHLLMSQNDELVSIALKNPNLTSSAIILAIQNTTYSYITIPKMLKISSEFKTREALECVLGGLFHKRYNKELILDDKELIKDSLRFFDGFPDLRNELKRRLREFKRKET